MTGHWERLPSLQEPYPLSREQCDKYRRDGHILLRSVATGEEVAAYRPPIQEAVRKWNRETRKLEDRGTYHKAFLQTSNLWENSEEVKRFVLAHRFARIAADLMGVEGVRLWHDQALFKEAGGGHTPWHQDQFYWPLNTSHTITMWMPLTEAPQESGALVFASGSHREGSLGSLAISDESSVFFRNRVIEKDYPLVTGDLAPGDATFHAGWTLHKAPGNSAGFTREVMTVIYFSDGTRVAEPANALQPKDLERWMPGLKPGDIAASPLNPLLYHRDWAH